MKFSQTIPNILFNRIFTLVFSSPMSSTTTHVVSPSKPAMSEEKKYPFFVGDGFYRYKIQATDSLTLTKKEMISCIHKLVRRNATVFLCKLLRIFFRAVKKICPPEQKKPLPKELKQAVTHFINRFAVAMFEEGVFLALNNTSRKNLVSLLVEWKQKCDKPTFDANACLQLGISIAMQTHNVWRGRWPSYVTNWVQNVYDGEKDTLFQNLSYDNVNSKGLMVPDKTRDIFVSHWCPEVLPLLRCRYKECKELTKMIWLSANVDAIFKRDAKLGTGTEVQYSDLYCPKAFYHEFRGNNSTLTREYLEEIGTFDCHTSMKTQKTYKIFIEVGSMCEHITPTKFRGFSHEELREYYKANRIATVLPTLK